MCSNGADDGASSLPSTRRHPVPVLPRAVCAGAAEFSIPTCPRRTIGQMYVELVESAGRSARHPRPWLLAPPPASATARPPHPRHARPRNPSRTAGPASCWPAVWQLGPICVHHQCRFNRAHAPHRASHTRSHTPWRDPVRRCCSCSPFPPAAAAATRQLGHFGASVPNGHSSCAVPTNSCLEAPDLSHGKAVDR